MAYAETALHEKIRRGGISKKKKIVTVFPEGGRESLGGKGDIINWMCGGTT